VVPGAAPALAKAGVGGFRPASAQSIPTFVPYPDFDTKVKINYFGKGSMRKSYQTLQTLQQASKWHSATKLAYTSQLEFVEKTACVDC